MVLTSLFQFLLNSYSIELDMSKTSGICNKIRHRKNVISSDSFDINFHCNPNIYVSQNTLKSCMNNLETDAVSYEPIV